MIDHTYRCIFIHQRKCAGSSIAKSFGYWFLDGPGSNYYEFNEGVNSENWEQRPRDYFIFSAVRNPFDRLVSAWKNIHSVRDKTLEEVVENWPQDFLTWIHVTRPQLEIIRDKQTGELVTQDLIRYENLQEDFDRVCDRIGKPRQEMPRINLGKRERDYRKYFTPHTRALAEKQFKEDLEYFNYDF